ncbi:MAG TPA: hypothetical protein VKV16_10035 [Solirubrobacteraceae bacterium]|nr:hypothetical protein [Solirubrobacteraceae bacterium]
MSVRRLRFFGEHAADPIWDERGNMISLDDLPVSDELRAQARAWSKRWDELASQQLRVDSSTADASDGTDRPVTDEQWESLDRDGRAVCGRLRDELGEGWTVEWDE